MKHVYPVRYRRNGSKDIDTFFIVANDSSEAEEIAFVCIANDPPPEGPDRPASYGRKVAEVWVMDHWAQQTETDKVGLVGSGSEILVAKALALYVKETNKLQ